jgi:hypothetical protein
MPLHRAAGERRRDRSTAGHCAQEPSVVSAIRAMSPMTGSDLAAARIEPTSGLVGIIVAISKPLRKIDLGEMEPATFYVAD